MIPRTIPVDALSAIRAGADSTPGLEQICASLLNDGDWTHRGALLLDHLPVEDELSARRTLTAVSEVLGTMMPQDSAGHLVRKMQYRAKTAGEGSAGRDSGGREGEGLHTEGPHREVSPPDVFLLLCVRQARRGRDLLLVEADRVVERLDDEVVRVLQRDFLFDQREPGSSPVARPILRPREGGGWQFTYRRRYVELGHQHVGAPPLSPDQQQALDQVDAALTHLTRNPRQHERLKLLPGEALVVDNRRLLHGRAEFADAECADGRLILRSWLKLGARTSSKQGRP